MPCSRCRADNPAGKRFCGDCGAPLPGSTPPSSAPDGAGAPSDLRQEIRAVVREETKDQKLLEIETSNAILARLAEWSKTYIFFLAVPLLILAAALAVFGVSSFTDFKGRVDEGKKALDGVVNDAKRQAGLLQEQMKSLTERTAGITTEIDKRRAQLAELDGLASRVQEQRAALEKQNTRIENQNKEFLALSERLKAQRVQLETVDQRVDVIVRREALQVAIDALDSTKAKDLIVKVSVSFPEVRPLVDLQYPSSTRGADADGSKAKLLLKRLISFTVRTENDVTKWQGLIAGP